MIVLVRSLVTNRVSHPRRRAGDSGVRHSLSTGGRKQETDDTTTTRDLCPTNAQFSDFSLVSRVINTHTRLGSPRTLVTFDDVRGIIAQIIQK